jgi:hypothetical protein
VLHRCVPRRDSGEARKRIVAVPAARRGQLTTSCKQLGVDITPHKKTDKPAEDCAADPMACQHLTVDHGAIAGGEILGSPSP